MSIARTDRNSYSNVQNVVKFSFLMFIRRVDEQHLQEHGHRAVGFCCRLRAVESEAEARVQRTEAARSPGRTEI